MTPISIIENYFETDLSPVNLGQFSAVSKDEWVDFSKQYWATCKSGFYKHYFAEDDQFQDKSRFYFENRLQDDIGKEVAKRYGVSPFLGRNHYQIESDSSTDKEVSKMLTPLKKHLLMADQVFIPDPFLMCFDFIGEVLGRRNWRSTYSDGVDRSIAAIKNWLPVLAHLKPLIESEALVFTPYYVSPAFNGGFYDKNFDTLRKALSIKDEQQLVSSPIVVPEVNFEEVAATWLSGYLLGVDMVYPNRAAYEIAQNIKLKNTENEVHSVITEPISMQINALGNPDNISLSNLVSWRNDNELFYAIRTLTASCKNEIADALGHNPTTLAVERYSRDYFRESLNKYEKDNSLKWASENIWASNGIAIGIGILTMPATAGWGILASLALNPANWRQGQIMLDKKHRAHTQILSIL